MEEDSIFNNWMSKARRGWRGGAIIERVMINHLLIDRLNRPLVN